MRERLFPLLVLAVLCFFSASAQSVVENESTLVYNSKTAEIGLVIDNPGPAFETNVGIELLNTSAAIPAAQSQRLKIENGKRSYPISLPLGDISGRTPSDLLWFRLKVSIGSNSTTISVSKIIRDAFELRVLASDSLLTGMTYRTRVRAIDPLNGRGVRDVSVNAILRMRLRDKENEFVRLEASSKTDADGFALLDFKIPFNVVYEGEGNLSVTGSKNGFEREAYRSVSVSRDDFNFLMLTDKPIYQPGQQLSVRGILMKGNESKYVVSGEEVEFRIVDEEDTVVYREKLQTSEFGIGAISWTIPDGVKLGSYRIKVKARNQEDGYYVGSLSVKISRYELPNFSVQAQSVKPYYLPTEKTAEIEVRADYLFGRPVANGKVRVVRETERSWNYKTQKYDIEEGDKKEGKADADGKFTARFDLGEDFDDISDYRGFADLNFTAYVTDPTTNRTEQRRFDVRISREPIHVRYVGNKYRNNPAMPVEAYVTTFYADGTPAACDVEFKGREEDEEKNYMPISRVKTNQYGVAKLDYRRPKFKDEDDDLEIQLIATDKNGLKGTYGIGEDNEESVEFDEDEEKISIRTDKTIYKPGETVNVKLQSTVKSGIAYIDVVRGWSVVSSQSAALRNGQAELTIPYQSELRGALVIAAYLESDEDDELIESSRGIIVPEPETLKVDASFGKETYKPGESALLNFGVSDPKGAAIESALGVVILDRAVEERARTDAEFGSMFSNFRGWLGDGKGFAGVNIKDINELDLSKPISEDLQVVGDMILHDSFYRSRIFHSNGYGSSPAVAYSTYFATRFSALSKLLQDHYNSSLFDHPSDEASFRRITSNAGFDLDSMRDPWDQKYKPEFSVRGVHDVVTIKSAGPDKTWGTEDDLVAFREQFEYFPPMKFKIDNALAEYHQRTGGYIRDEKTLLAELGMSQFLDGFGFPYRFEFTVSGKYFRTTIRSVGPDGKYESRRWTGDDFEVYTQDTNYFIETEQRIRTILETADPFPTDEATFRATLKKGGIDPDQLRDGNGDKLLISMSKSSRYYDRVTVEMVQEYGSEKMVERKIITPVTQETLIFTIKGIGVDKKPYTYDDPTFAQFLKVLSERTKDDVKPVPVRPVAYTGAGAIAGTVTDPNGAVVPGATVTAISDTGGTEWSTKTNDTGEYLFAGLAPGTYDVRASAPGFMNTVRSAVPVISGSTIYVNIALQIAGATSTVDVTSDDSVTVETSSTSVQTSITTQSLQSLPQGTDFSSMLKLAPGVQADGTDNVVVIDGRKVVRTPDGSYVPYVEKETPRLRQYFPETLLWRPEVVTGPDGKASVAFKMADNITTWKLYTIASTKDGRLGVAEKEVAVFQPFFVDLDPPKFLTEGDEIHLPTQVRNYTKSKQKVDVTMDKSDWFSFLTPERRTIDVDKNAAANAIFGFRATNSVKDGKQRVTAEGQTDSDAIEKPVTVRPDGEEISRTESRLSSGSVEMPLEFPANALPNTPRAELKIFPNMMAHITESVEGLLKRPYGCGEQTISSTYPNLMILKFDDGLTDEARPLASRIVRNRANRYLKAGFERLLGYQSADGGFSYWGGNSTSDDSLTAYAIRFLTDAKDRVEIDPKTIERAAAYLATKQRANGSWTRIYSWEKEEDLKRTLVITTHITRSLTRAGVGGESVKKALAYLKTRNAEIDEPYALANYGLAALDSGDTETARRIADKLSSMAIAEGPDKVYWNLETNTPFYGWGTPGRIETTALVVQLLARVGELDQDQSSKVKDQISKATLFLLKNKDRYGVWYSTQATVNVLDALLATLTKPAAQPVTVSVNGTVVRTIDIAADQIEPATVDLTDRIAPGTKVEVTASNESKVLSQLVTSHYIDWKDSQSTSRNVNQSRAAELGYSCDKTNGRIMETVTCSVSAERVGFKGYGMLLAEIGIPPGAEVSRESLEKAMVTDRSVSRYEIQPDRIVVYMWANPGGTKFTFSFKPRYGINAQTPASVLYDYYNEEAKATVTPIRFRFDK